MGYTCKSSFKITEKNVRIMSNSEYLAHSEPLFKTLKLLKIEDVYKLKLMKFSGVPKRAHILVLPEAKIRVPALH